MKPILLFGTDAFSPFRLDALKSAMGKLVPGMEKAELRTRWVYEGLPQNYSKNS